MASVTAFIRTSQKNPKQANIRFRLRDGRKTQLFHSSELTVDPIIWDNNTQTIKARAVCNIDIKTKLLEAVAQRKNIILRVYDACENKENATSQWLETEIDKYLHPDKYKSGVSGNDFFGALDLFINRHIATTSRKRQFYVVVRALKRFELFKQKKTNYYITFANFDSDTLYEFDNFLKNEFQYFAQYLDIYQAVPESRTPQKRGQNTISGIFIKIRTFIIWSIKEEITTYNPFGHFKIEEQIYGTPYYITIDERNRLYRTNLSRHPRLAIQRDIFIFQCMIGCRVGDFIKMTKTNIINGAVEYIPRKTKEGRPITVRVPLNATAKEILERYSGVTGATALLPFISEQKYNDAIKVMFRAARLTRMVTVINPTTREEQKRPLNEIASSHLARRCFVGNLYKQVKDPNLVGALSGHKDGSKAFARYREIDEQMKSDLVNLLE